MNIGVRTGQLSVERAVRRTLAVWLGHYVVSAARRLVAEDTDTTAAGYISPAQLEALLVSGFPYQPRSMNVASSFDDWHVDALPHVQILSPSYTAAGGDQTGLAYHYEIQVAVLVGAEDAKDTRFIRACYEEAVPGVIMNHQDLGGIASSVRHAGGGGAGFDVAIDEKSSRTFQGGVTVFEVLVQGVLQPFAGPQGPPSVLVAGQAPPVWPTDPTVVDDGAGIDVVPERPV